MSRAANRRCLIAELQERLSSPDPMTEQDIRSMFREILYFLATL